MGSKLKNALVPKHEILGEKEASMILKSYNVTPNELPRIKKSDPSIKELNPEVGNIIKITRKSPSAGTAFYYRVVIYG